MSKKQFELPAVSPLMGATSAVFTRTVREGEVDPDYRKVVRNSRAIMNILSPFRAYEESAVLPKARKSSPEKIVFIVGHWRSGTTFLHNLMCSALNSTFISTYHTVFANYMGSQALVKPIMRIVMPDRRPADNMKLDADLPQEEEFALSNTNPHSYYRFMYFPRNYDKYYREAIHFEGLTAGEVEAFTRDYRDIIHKAQYFRPAQNMIVKNPVNTGRVAWLHQQYPDAKFIHIYRSPYDVYRSTFRFFSQLLPTLWFQVVDEQFISDMIFDIYKRVHVDYEQQLSTVPEAQVAEVRYESFVENPMTELERLYSDLDIDGFEDSREVFQTYCDARKSHKQQAYQYSDEERGLIHGHLGEWIDRWGY